MNNPSPITSLQFILVWVPDPVCQMTNGKWSSYNCPEMTSLHAVEIASAIFGSKPNSLFTSAAAFFSTPMAVITGFCNKHVLCYRHYDIDCVFFNFSILSLVSFVHWISIWISLRNEYQNEILLFSFMFWRSIKLKLVFRVLYSPAYVLYRHQLESWFLIALFVRHSICQRAPSVHQMYRFRHETHRTITYRER